MVGKGVSGIYGAINQKLGEIGVSGIIIFIIILIIVLISSRRQRRIFSKEMRMRKQVGLFKDSGYGLTNDYAIKFYSKGVFQLNENFF